MVDAVIEKFGWLEDLLILLTNVEHTLEWPTVHVASWSVGAVLYFRKVKRLARDIRLSDCWIIFSSLKSTFGKILDEWNSKRDLIGPGFFLYLATRRGMDLYTEFKFVGLVFGLESFHRTLNHEIRNERLELKIARIVDQIASPKDKKWLTDRLKNISEPNLQQRIFEILRSLPIGLDERRLQAFAGRCAKFRNDISHHGQIKEPGAYRRHMMALSHLNEALSHLYHARILCEIGIPSGLIQSVFSDSHHAFHLKYVLWQVGLADADPRFENLPQLDDM